jgi:hypothetical protein
VAVDVAVAQLSDVVAMALVVVGVVVAEAGVVEEVEGMECKAYIRSSYQNLRKVSHLVNTLS